MFGNLGNVAFFTNLSESDTAGIQEMTHSRCFSTAMPSAAFEGLLEKLGCLPGELALL